MNSVSWHMILCNTIGYAIERPSKYKKTSTGVNLRLLRKLNKPINTWDRGNVVT